MSTEENELSFEQALTQLEDIVENLEKENIPLEQAINFYQEGMKLSKVCDDILKNAQEKMTKILNEEDKLASFQLEEDKQ